MSAYRVLVPLDGSRLAERSLIYLDALRNLGELEVLLLSVVDESEDFHGLSHQEAIERETNLLTTYQREVASDIEKHLGIATEQRILIGSPAACILTAARDFQPDLLVIATHGRTGASRWRFGSVADKVIRGADCNVLVAGPHALAHESWLEGRLVAPFKSILVPLDGSPLAEAALPVAGRFAAAFGSTLHVVRVVGVPAVADAYGSEMTYLPELLESAMDAARAYLQSVAARHKDLKLEQQVLIGSAALQLEEYVNLRGIDLIIMTSHGRGGVLRSALGSVTDRLLGSQAPVLVVRGHA